MTSSSAPVRNTLDLSGLQELSRQRLTTSTERSSIAKEFTRHEYMTKQGAMIKNWKRRYFSLSPEKMQISYYKTAADCLEKRKPLGIITLEDARARRAEYDFKREHMLEIYYPKYPKRRIYKIVAQSEHGANCWVETVNQLTSYDRTSLDFTMPQNMSIAQGEVEIEVNNNPFENEGEQSPKSPKGKTETDKTNSPKTPKAEPKTDKTATSPESTNPFADEPETTNPFESEN